MGKVAPAHAQNAVRADVRIEIKQKLSLERRAFDALTRVNNGLQTGALQNVGINLTFRQARQRRCRDVRLEQHLRQGFSKRRVVTKNVRDYML